MAKRCPTAKVVGKAAMRNWQLLFRGTNGGAVATVERLKGGFVPVLVWDIQPSDEASLDRYEGWPRLYRKETVRVRLGGKQVYAMIYIMNEGPPFGKPGEYYYNVIREGYKSAGFDISILRKAAQFKDKSTDALIKQKLKREYGRFMSEIRQMSKEDILARIDIIAAMSEVHDALTSGEIDFGKDTSEYLLAVANPLDLITEYWLNNDKEITASLEYSIWNICDQDLGDVGGKYKKGDAYDS
jgi:hypothetical protein